MSKPKIFKSQILGARMDVTNNRIYFWGGIFSQWYKCHIYDDKLDLTFVSAEQLMMYWKAVTFNDNETAKKIHEETDPKECKALGRLIKNFDSEKWDEVKYRIVKRASYLKFSQSPDLKEWMIMCSGFEFVEASPYDKIWGVGLGQDDPLIYDKNNWQGKNLLGMCLNDACAKIIDEL